MIVSDKFVRERYKMSEFGEIPLNWHSVDFKDYVFYQEGPGLRKWQFTLEGMKVINVTNITQNGLDITNTQRHITLEEYEQKYKHFSIDEGDIVIASSGNSWGKSAKVSREHLPLLLNTSVIRFKTLDSNILNLEYLWHFVNSTLFLKQIEFLITGSAQPNFGPYHLGKIKLLLPSLTEQQKIAEILSTVDEHIENTEQLIEKTKELKKGLMQQLLTKGIGHTEFKQTELGEIPVDWEVKSFKDVMVLQRGFDLPTQQRIAGFTPILSANGITGNHNEAKVKGPGIVTGRSGTIGKVHYIERDFWPLNTALYVKEMYNNDSKFLFYFLISFGLEKYSTGTGVPTLNRNDVHKIKVAVPRSIEEQQKIASILSSVDNQIENYKQEKEKYLELKKGLMQQLLTGKIRVTV